MVVDQADILHSIDPLRYDHLPIRIIRCRSVDGDHATMRCIIISVEIKELIIVTNKLVIGFKIWDQLNDFAIQAQILVKKAVTLICALRNIE